MRSRMRFRLLPVVIFAGVLALTLKVGTLWNLSGITVSEATAANAETAPAADKGASHAPAAAGGHGAAAAGKSGADPRGGVGDQFDPSSVTEAEFEVLQRLAKRRDELDKRQSDLALREKVLAATEKRIDGKISELDQLKNLIQGLLKKHDAEQEKKLQSLVKIYEKMKPKNAARIFEQLDMNILLDVVERMREAKTAPIFAAMSPAKAKAVTARLAERRELPDPMSLQKSGG